jgi:hypothetical protein
MKFFGFSLVSDFPQGMQRTFVQQYCNANPANKNLSRQQKMSLALWAISA